MSTGEGSANDLATARGRDWPSVRQFNVFLANRVGALVNVFRSDIDFVDEDAVAHLLIDAPEVGDLRGLRAQFLDRRRPWRPEGVVLEKPIAVEQVYLAYRCLGDKIQDIGPGAAPPRRSRFFSWSPALP